ncbi:anti-sigma factor family protein [Ammonifex thiophilus]|uniref:DUF4349 domain-containing protein n=1 Tax=Ammonifex thiophilus TaxID=444093 RepID=A0A3D8P5A6_9THEO|nr:DUF4349 domain-containing protein [Ammonifex thiophilus]RDV84506.1 DUF4349 domain-containing protein [Ammonifex thiophilus]
MYCQEARRLIWESEELPEEAREHVANCPSCQQVYCLWQRTRRALFLPAPPAPPGFKDRVVDRLRGERRSRGWRWLALAAAGLLLLSGSAWAFFKKSEHFLPPPTQARVVAEREGTPTSQAPATPPAKQESKPEAPPDKGTQQRQGEAEKPGKSAVPAPPSLSSNQGEPRAGKGVGATESTNRVFLSHSQTVRSTLLRLQVADVIVAQGKVETLARQFGGQKVNQVKPFEQMVVLQFLLPDSEGEAFVNALLRAGVGSLQSWENSSRDVTQELANLKVQLVSASPAERPALEQQIKDLEEAAAKYTVTVCLMQET